MSNVKIPRKPPFAKKAEIDIEALKMPKSEIILSQANKIYLINDTIS